MTSNIYCSSGSIYHAPPFQYIFEHSALEKCSDKVFRTAMVSMYVLILLISGIQISLRKIQIWALLFQGVSRPELVPADLQGMNGFYKTARIIPNIMTTYLKVPRKLAPITKLARVIGI